MEINRYINGPCTFAPFRRRRQSKTNNVELYLATPYFSLFVLELPLPKRKAEVKFHYLFWNFGSQIETRKPIVQNELSLAAAHFLTVRFGTSVPKSKSGSLYSLFVLELPLPDQKEKADLSQFVLERILEKQVIIRFWNSPSKSKKGR